MPGTPLRPDAVDAAILEAIDRAEDIASVRIRTILLRYLRSIRAGAADRYPSLVDLANPEVALRTALYGSSAKDLAELERELQKVFGGGYRVGFSLLPAASAAALGQFRDTAAGAAARRFAAVRSSDLVTVVTEETRAGLRDVLAAALDGTGPGSLRRIREGLAGGLREALRRGDPARFGGLNQPQTMSLLKYGQELAERGLSPARIDRALTARHRLLLNARATLIARTEAASAGNQGLLDAWREAVTRGALDPDVYEREWITRSVGACPRCSRLDGARASIVGGVFSQGGEVAAMAPLHPKCMCTNRIVRRRETLRRAAPQPAPVRLTA